MSKRNPGNIFQKAPSKKDVEAIIKKRKEEEKYPMPDENDLKNAGAFIYTLGVLAESYDENLKALVWTYYVNLMNCLRKDSGQEQLFEMIKTLTYLKEYLANSKNPLFTDKVEKK